MIDLTSPMMPPSDANKFAKRWFNIFDKDKDGKLYLDEIRSLDSILIKTFNFRQDDDLLIKLLQILDPEQKGYITQNDFEEIIMKYLCLSKFKNAHSGYMSKQLLNSNHSWANSYLDLGKYGTFDSRPGDAQKKGYVASPDGKLASSVKSEIIEENDEELLPRINNVFNTCDDREKEKDEVEGRGRKKRVLKVSEQSEIFKDEPDFSFEECTVKNNDKERTSGLYKDRFNVASFGDHQNSGVNFFLNKNFSVLN